MASTSQDSEIELNCSLAAGPHQPILNFPKQTFGKQQRSFSVSWKPVSLDTLCAREGCCCLF